MMPAAENELLAKDFKVEVKDGIATLFFDIPGVPVNTLSPEISAEIDRLFAALEKDAEVRAVVFTSGKKEGFVAGADISRFQEAKSAAEARAVARAMQETFNRMERFKKPILAAIHGPALGGGLELALACHYRMASDSPKTQLGSPEVQLGLIPGAGGTQRLPRLIGIPAALDMVMTGRPVRSKKAQKLGLVDEVVPAPILLQVARERALDLASRRVRSAPPSIRRISEDTLGALQQAAQESFIGREIIFRKARADLLAKTHGHYPAPEKALEAVRYGYENGFEKGLEHEAQLFGDLAVSETAKRLIDIFFAQRALKKDTGADPSVKPRLIDRIGILGGGLMGGGIGFVSIQAGLPVRVREKDDPGVGRALAHVRALLDDRVKKRAIDTYQRDEQMRLASATTGWQGFEKLPMVIEAVFENLELKQEMVRKYESLNPSGIFATNTSSIPIAKIASASQHPETVVGMHYFSPVEKMPLLEIVVTDRTAPEVTATAVAVGKRQGKTPIVVKDGPGFYTTRILVPYLNEAAFLLAEGGAVDQIDQALVDFGMPVGPLQLVDEIGIDVGIKVAKVVHEGFGERMTAPEALAKVAESGRQGRKNKKGFYTYGTSKKEVDETVYDQIPGGRSRKKMDPEEIVNRVALQFVNEAIRCLGEGIIRSPRDGDMGAILGLGFPPFRGGPFRYADALGTRVLLDTLRRLHEKHGKRFEPAPLLVEMAGKPFYKE